ncbi:bifunctional methionine sulfoxide reductase [Streptococcus pneumoniae]|nr:bifunctional methionine sulfoxide reductase [Streptococcus pneumoniae]
MAEIYLAGGCFWGLEEYFSRISGVLETSVGYANGQVETTNYQLLKETDHAETVQVIYDEKEVSLREILLYYFRVIDPLSINQQGNDRGRHAALLGQTSVHCRRFPTAASRRSLGRVSVPVWPITLSGRLCIVALVSRYPTN